MRTVIIDTRAIYALVMRSDKNHDAARRFLQQLLKEPASLLLHEWVFVEAMTLLKVRGGSGVAIRAGEEMKQNPLYRWQPSTPQLEQLAWGIFERYSDKDWSYTDCALLALSQQAKVAEVWTYDQNLKQATLWKKVGR
jgi:predicted nucleic acid-binding protein